MPKRSIKFIKGFYYHIYNRGLNKQRIFLETYNYLHFLKLLTKYTSHFEIKVIAYCLMPNHFHFLLRNDGDKDISGFMSTMLNAYVKAFNKKYNRTGSLFSHRFKSIHVDRDNYLVHLCRYIHLNPLKANLVTELKDWPFSNYFEFVGKRNGKFIDKDFIKSFFTDALEYEDFVEDIAIEYPDNFDNFIFG